MKQLSLDLPTPELQTPSQKPWRIYPRLISEPVFELDHCHFQAIHSFRTNKYLVHFTYHATSRSHLPSVTTWRKVLRRHRIPSENIRLIRQISKLICLASHRGKELTVPKKLLKRCESSLRGKMRFKKPLVLDCLNVQCQVGSDYTAGQAELLCCFVPATSQLFVLKTTYTQCTRADLGFSGIRRTAILEKIQRHCVAHWKHHLTLPLFT